MGSRAQTGRVTAQRYEHSRYENSDTVKMAAVSTNGHTNMEGMKVKGQEEFREEDGYFTCAVSVQHKPPPLPALSVSKVSCTALPSGGQFLLLPGSAQSLLPPSGLDTWTDPIPLLPH